MRDTIRTHLELALAYRASESKIANILFMAGRKGGGPPLSPAGREHWERLYAKRFAQARGHAFRAVELAYDLGARRR